MKNTNAPKILVIDDESAILQLLSKVLSKNGYVVDTADNGEEAIHQINQKSYDLILTDIKMPGLSGTQILHYVKTEAEKNNSVPVIGMSGTPWLLDELIFDAVLTKPCPNKELLTILNQFIEGFVLD